MSRLRLFRERSTEPKEHGRDLRGLDTRHIDAHFFGSIVLTVEGPALSGEALESLSHLLMPGETGAKKHGLRHLVGSRGGLDKFRGDAVDLYAWVLKHSSSLKKTHRFTLWEARTFPWAMKQAIEHKDIPKHPPIADLAPDEARQPKHFLSVCESARIYLAMAGCVSVAKGEGTLHMEAHHCGQALSAETVALQAERVDFRKAA
jgi:hypothetical protein